MFHVSLQFSNVDTQYIMLVTALEALIPDTKPAKEDPELVKAFDVLLEYAKKHDQLGPKTKDNVVNALNFAKQESIMNLGSKLAKKLETRQYDSLSPDEYFQRAYKRRSSLVHANISKRGAPLDRQIIFDDLQTLRRFVADLLAAEAGYLEPETPPNR